MPSAAPPLGIADRSTRSVGLAGDMPGAGAASGRAAARRTETGRHRNFPLQPDNLC